jgi:hypothetical protein
MRRASIGLLLVAALLVWAPSAWGRSSTKEVDLEGDATGQVTLTWHGDPARGCAAAGVCDVSGSIVFKPGYFDVYGVLRPDGRFYPGAAFVFTSDPAIVQTRRQVGAGPPSACLDLVDADGVTLSPTEQPGGRYSFDVSTAHSYTNGLSTGRCAGPTAKQLETAFPTGLLQTPKKGHRSRLLDLTGRKSFTAGPFSGELVSTVTARLWPEFYGDDEDDSESDSVPDRHRRTLRLLTVEFEYGIQSMAGSLVTTFSGSADPFCRPFDSCGVQGTSTYSTATKGGDVGIGGYRVLGRHEKVTRRAALRELRAGRLAVSGDSILADGALARIASSVRHADGSSCTDPGETSPLAPLTVARARKAAHFVLGSSIYDRGNTLRTDCQGPSEDDVLGPKAALATGSVPVTALGAKSLQVKLAAAGSFRAGAYTGSRSGAIDLRLVRKAARIRVVRVRVSDDI